MDLAFKDNDLEIEINSQQGYEIKLGNYSPKELIKNIFTTEVNKETLYYFILNNEREAFSNLSNVKLEIKKMDDEFGSSLYALKSQPINTNYLNKLKQTLEKAFILINLTLINLDIKFKPNTYNTLLITMEYKYNQQLENNLHFYQLEL